MTKIDRIPNMRVFSFSYVPTVCTSTNTTAVQTVQYHIMELQFCASAGQTWRQAIGLRGDPLFSKPEILAYILLKIYDRPVLFDVR
jgi:hypothetical protein